MAFTRDDFHVIFIVSRTCKWAHVLLLLTLLLVTDFAVARETKRILVLFENESSLFATMEVSRGLRQRLDTVPPTNIELYIEHLDLVRFSGEKQREQVREALSAKYQGVSIDLIITLGGGALSFFLHNRSDFQSGTPLVFGGVSKRRVPEIPMDDSMWGVVSRFDMKKSLDLAIALQPRAQRIHVLTGSSTFDQGWHENARTELGSRYQGLDVEYLANLSLESFKSETGKLDPDDILLILTVFKDAEGRSYTPRDVAAEIAAVSAAPTYAVYSSFIGSGVVGGYVETFVSMGESVGALANQILEGTQPSERVISTEGDLVVDWRRLTHWGIDTNRVPIGVRIENHELSAWEQYRTEIVVALVVFLLQAATIVGLIFTDRRRRQIRDELALQRLELSHLARATQLGELSGAFAHELNQPLTAILANAEAGRRMIEVGNFDQDEIGEIFSDIVSDDKRAATYITQLRRLMLKEKVAFESLDLNSVVKVTVDLVNSEFLARNTTLEFHPDPGELMVTGNLAQLQQVAINLLLNAADAVSDLAPGQRKIRIRTRNQGDGFASLSVSDPGPGISTELQAQMFKPFFTTKSEGMGLGLAICRTIAEAHGGSLEVDPSVSEGVRIVFKLPRA